MRKQTLQAITLGCSKNRVDTEHLLSQIEGVYDILPEDEDAPADVILLNTCGFIGDAKEESIQAIFDAVARKKAGEVSKIVVFGCLSQRYESEMPELIPEVDAWFGAREIAPIAEYFGVKWDSSKETCRHSTQSSPSYAYLKISEGCDRRCSYCAIPHIRGAHKSVPMETLVEEARRLAETGVRELEIIAQDTTFYGLDLYHRRALAELLERLSAVDGIERLRIHYSYPADFPEDVLEQMASNPKVCKYMDIPLQHVSDKVLDNMHRHVDGAWTRQLIRTMREKVPGIVLRTTLIVGHPGESEKEFEELMDFVKEAHFERLGAFTYSEEEGTWGAENLSDDVPFEVKQERLDRLMTLQSQISLDYNLSRVGSVVKVLVDDITEDGLVCRSEFESPEVDGEIYVPLSPEMKSELQNYIGTFIDVKITKADEYDLVGEYIG